MNISGSHVKGAGIAAGILLLILGLDFFIVTDKERIKAAVESSVESVEDGEPEKLFKNISPLYRDESHDYMGFRMLAETLMPQYGGGSVRIRDMKTNIAGSTAVVVVSVLASGDSGVGTSVWQFRLQRERDKNWLIRSITPVRVNARDVAGWKEIYSGRGW